MTRTIELTATYRKEDVERTLVFVDMLGFAELTRRHPFRVYDKLDGVGTLVASVSRLQTQLVRFQRVIDVALTAEAGSVSAQVFSDCAFLDVGTSSSRGPAFAADLMRSFLAARVPVRMGVGQGTYYAFRHSLEQSDSQLVARALFAGTAVVNAHGAEQCGGKGCRIFVHWSSEESLRYHHVDAHLIPVEPALGSVRSEVSYLPVEEVIPDDEVSSNINQDLRLLRFVREIEGDSEPIPQEVRRHYTETYEALDRMHLRRPGAVSLTKLDALDRVS